MVVNRDGSGLRTLFSKQRPEPLGAVPYYAAIPLLLGPWIRAGHELLFATTEVLPSGFTKFETTLWALPDNGAPPRPTGLAAPGLREIRSEPRGNRLLYTSIDHHVDTWILNGVLRENSVRQ
jgi:hypothetical protein